MMPDNNAVRSRLTGRLGVLHARIEEIEHDMQRPHDADSAEQAVEREQDQALDALETATLREIAHTEQALARLAAGSYGVCQSCGVAIAPARLAAVPMATECISCAAGSAA